MYRKNYLIAIIAALLSLSSCSNDDDEPQQSKYITISTKIGTMSRVATDVSGSQSFENGDTISVYAWTGTNADGEIAAPDKDNRVVNNSHNILSNDSWIAEPQMLWKDMMEKHYFIGVYPAIEQGKGFDDDLTQYAYTLNPAYEEASDLLVATETSGILAGYGTVPLAFTHTMAKVNINLTYRNQWGVDEAGENIVPTVTSVQLINAANKAVVNLLTKKVTPIEDSRSNQTLPELAENSRYSSIVIPQEHVNEITIVIDGKNYTYTHSSDIDFTSGKVTTINLTVGRNVITLSGVTVDPWDEVTNPIIGVAD